MLVDVTDALFYSLSLQLHQSFRQGIQPLHVIWELPQVRVRVQQFFLYILDEVEFHIVVYFLLSSVSNHKEVVLSDSVIIERRLNFGLESHFIVLVHFGETKDGPLAIWVNILG